MKALALALLLLLGACSCATDPVPGAQATINWIKADYRTARAFEQEYADRPDCETKDADDYQPSCAERRQMRDARRAGFDAEAAIVTADGERTERALQAARHKVDAYMLVTGGLR